VKVCIYCRVSTQDQNIEQQVDFCKKYAKAKGWEVLYTFKDKESGTIPLKERKVFSNIINTVKGTAEGRDFYKVVDDCDAILIYRLDRLTRNWKDVPIIEKIFVDSNTNLLSTADAINLKTSDGRFMFRFLMMLAVKEVEVMKERQKIGIDRAKAEGKFKGGKKGRKWAK